MSPGYTDIRPRKEFFLSVACRENHVRSFGFLIRFFQFSMSLISWKFHGPWKE